MIIIANIVIVVMLIMLMIMIMTMRIIMISLLSIVILLISIKLADVSGTDLERQHLLDAQAASANPSSWTSMLSRHRCPLCKHVYT